MEGWWMVRGACFMLRTCTAACLVAKPCSQGTTAKRLHVAFCVTRAAAATTSIGRSDMGRAPFTENGRRFLRRPAAPARQRGDAQASQSPRL